MKDRLATLLLTLAALGLFWVLLFPKPLRQRPTTRPLSTDVGTEGYGALARWLGAGGTPVAVLRARYDHLADPRLGLPSTGNLLVTTLPWAVTLQTGELDELQKWVGRGNVLLVLAALDDTPRWSAAASPAFPALLQQLTLVKFVVKPVAQADVIQRTTELLAEAAASGIRTELLPAGRHPLLAGVAHLSTRSPLPSSQWRAEAMDTAPLLELARSSDGSPALWLRPLDGGTVVVSAYASPFANGVLGTADNGRFMANLIAWSLGARGRVIFDDAHQGALDEYDAAAFYADPRLHRTLWWIVGLWLAWVLASQPLRAAAPPAAGMDESAMLQLSAGFFANVLQSAGAARQLLARFFDDLRLRLGQPADAPPPWEWLGRQAGIDGPLLRDLQALHARAEAGRRVDLMRLQKLIAEISGRLS